MGTGVSGNLGRTPAGYREKHVCGNCGEFAPLWDCDWDRWCDKCVRENGGLVEAASIARDRWQEHAAKRRRETTERAEKHKAEVAARLAAEDAKAKEARTQRNEQLWEKAQRLWKHMPDAASPEQAYDIMAKARPESTS